MAKKSRKGIGGAPKGNHNHRIHGMCRTRLYFIWKTMRQRCSNPSCKSYSKYGARGIRVCKEWENFEAFQKWAIANGYREDLTIDRIDVNGNYEPSNCRWADITTQANNRRNTVYVTINGETKNLHEWSKTCNVSHKTIWERFKRGVRGEYLLVDSLRGVQWKSSRTLTGR